MNHFKCPKCGKPTDGDNKFCTECGEPLNIICPKCGEEWRYTMEYKFCPNCGHNMKEGGEKL